VPSGLQLEVKSRLIFDPLRRLSQFVSSVGFPSAEDVLTVRGALDGSQLRLSVHSGEVTIEKEIPLPQKALLSDALSPQTHLPGLREGQTWSVEIFSPLRPPGSPVEIVQATVEGTAPIVWDGQLVETQVVVYRNDPGAGTIRSRQLRGRLWVRRDGTVLKQQVTLFNCTMEFVRLPDKEAAVLAERVGDWQ
jgi:hypothetical protein